MTEGLGQIRKIPLALKQFAGPGAVITVSIFSEEAEAGVWSSVIAGVLARG